MKTDNKKTFVNADVTLEQAAQRIDSATKGKHHYSIEFSLRRTPGLPDEWRWLVYVSFDEGGQDFQHPLLRGAVELAELHIRSRNTMANLAAVSAQIPNVTTLGRRSGKRTAA